MSKGLSLPSPDLDQALLGEGGPPVPLWSTTPLYWEQPILSPSLAEPVAGVQGSVL